MSWPPPDGTSYRPSNGTEGCCFQEGWCQRCRADLAFQLDPDNADGCWIIANTLAFDVNDPKYPKEWVWKDGEPHCTAFEHVDDEPKRITEEERAANLELPLEAR